MKTVSVRLLVITVLFGAAAIMFCLLTTGCEEMHVPLMAQGICGKPHPDYLCRDPDTGKEQLFSGNCDRKLFHYVQEGQHLHHCDACGKEWY